MASGESKTRSGPGAGIISSGIIVLASSIFLLAYDKNLMKYGMLHWYGLIAYVVIVVILLGVAFASAKGASAGLLAVSIIFIVLILADAALGLPLSQFHTSTGMYGWRYLFGFGYAGDSSTLLRSSALVIDLVFSAVLAGFSAGRLRR